jgi:cytochrome c553
LTLPLALLLWTGAPVLGQEKPPAWAYPVNPPDFKPPPEERRAKIVRDGPCAHELEDEARRGGDRRRGRARGRLFCLRQAAIGHSLVIRVAESETVPKTVVAAWFLVADKAGGTEPIGERIIEIADDLGRFVSRDPRVTFTAYVPVGSIQKGRDLAAGKEPNSVACGTCHGEGLKGTGNIPGIAGRSPTYIFRQLYDYKQGVRAGPASAAMMPSVAELTTNGMVALSAYAGSLAP